MSYPLDFKTFFPEFHPDDDSSTVGGDIDEASGEVSQTSPNVLFPSVAANPLGGLDIVHRYKLCRANKGSGTIGGPPRGWIANGLKAPSVAGAVTIVVTHASDVGKVLISGFVGGVNDYEEIDINGPGSYNSSKDFDVDGVWRAENLTAGGALIAANADIEIWRGSLLGIITGPQGATPGHVTATREFELWVEPNVSGTATAANRLSDPIGASFQRAYLESEALQIGAGLTIPVDDFAAYWLRRTIKAGLKAPVDYVFPVVRWKFTA